MLLHLEDPFGYGPIFTNVIKSLHYRGMHIRTYYSYTYDVDHVSSCGRDTPSVSKISD